MRKRGGARVIYRLAVLVRTDSMRPITMAKEIRRHCIGPSNRERGHQVLSRIWRFCAWRIIRLESVNSFGFTAIGPDQATFHKAGVVF
jgi:hypothetical protein